MTLIQEYIKPLSLKLPALDDLKAEAFNRDLIDNINQVLIKVLDNNSQRIDLWGNGLKQTTAITEVTDTSATASVNRRYYADNAALVTITLPATASIGDVIEIRGKGAGMWRLAQNASQLVRFGTSTTTTGTGGYLQATAQFDCIKIECLVADTTWIVVGAIGNITVV